MTNAPEAVILPAKWKVLSVICVDGSPTLHQGQQESRWIPWLLTLETQAGQLLPLVPPSSSYIYGS